MVSGIGMNAVSQPVNNHGYSSHQLGSVMKGLRDQYGCEDCFEHGPYFVQYPIPVQELPKRAARRSLWDRVLGAVLGG